MKNAYYFFSDVHLGMSSREEEKLKEKIFIKFLDTIREDAAEVFIVGDLFDYWIEYKNVIPKGYYRVFSKLADLIDDGIIITYLAGNHDFWNGKYFKDEFGIDINFEPIERILDDKKFFIHHGDGLAYKDTGYKILKKVLRNPLSQFLYRWVHPDIGIKLARSTSRTSRDHTHTKDYSENDGLRDFAKFKLSQGYDFILMGHRHNPESFKYGEGLYVNLGDWIDNFTYAKFQKGKFEFKRFYNKKNNDFTEEIIEAIG
ncbi:UDP-2,3-diacylglucosamine diphosphatase [soil metagenome]